MHSQICHRTSVLWQFNQRVNLASVSNSFPGKGSPIPTYSLGVISTMAFFAEFNQIVNWDKARAAKYLRWSAKRIGNRHKPC